MHQLRRSISIPHHSHGERQQLSTTTKHESRRIYNRSQSLDTLIVSHSERCPPTNFDLSVAAALLDAKGDQANEASASTGLGSNTSRRCSALSTDYSNLASSYRHPTMESHCRDTSAASLQPGRAISDIFNLNDNVDIDAEISALRYNELARRYGFENLRTLEECTAGLSSGHEDRKRQKGLWRYLSRSSSSSDRSEIVEPDIVRKRSVSNLMRKRSKLTLSCRSLDQMYRLGGTSLLSLPRKYTSTELAVPSCLAAIGNYLALHGPTTPGIFRIPGQMQAVNALYDHYVSRMRDVEIESEQIQGSVGHALLAHSDVQYSVHDVASAFKKFLWDVPGGVLGTPVLFRVLRDIQAFRPPPSVPSTEWKTARPRLIAFAIMSLRSKRRIALCSAVFGLLALIKTDEFDGKRPLGKSRKRSGFAGGQEQMSASALAVIFAPILLGGLCEQIDALPVQSESKSATRSPKRSLLSRLKPPKRAKTDNIARPDEINVSVERSSVAAAVAEMLVRDWELIAQYMTLYRTSSRSTSRSTLVQSGQSRIHASNRRAFSVLPPIESPATAQMKCIPPTDAFPRGDRFFSDAPAEKVSSEPQRQISTKPPHILPTPFAIRDEEDSRLHRLETEGSSECTKPQCAQKTATVSSSSSRWPSFHPAYSSPVDEVRPAWWESPSRASSGRRSDPVERERRQRSSISQHNKEHTRMDSMMETTPNVGPRVDAPSNNPVNTCVSQVEHITGEAKRCSSVDPLPTESGPSCLRTEPIQDSQPDVTCSNQSKESAPRLFVSEPVSDNKLDDQRMTRKDEVNGNDAAAIPTRTLGFLNKFSHERVNVLLSVQSEPKKLAISPTRDGFQQPQLQAHSEPKTRPSRLPRRIHPRGTRVVSSSPLQRTQQCSWHFDAAEASLCTERSISVNEDDTKASRGVISLERSRTLQSANAHRQESKLSVPGGGMSLVSMPFHGRRPRVLSESDDSEPPIARRLVFRPIDETTQSLEADTAGTDPFCDAPPQRKDIPKVNVGTLYAEIRRLNLQLEARNETVMQLQQELKAIRYAKDTATLSEKLRDAEREGKIWKGRAQWAEATLFRRSRIQSTSTEASI